MAMATLAAPTLLRGEGEGVRRDTSADATPRPAACDRLAQPSHPKISHSSRTDVAAAEHLWNDYFTNPSKWWDNRISKATPRSPDFKHRITKEALWIGGWNNPSWVQDKLQEMGKGMHSPKPDVMPENFGWEDLGLEEALTYLERMPRSPSIQNLTCILRNCRRERNVAYTLRLHACLRKSGLEAHKSLGNYLVPMLVDVGSMCDAQQVFERLVHRNEHSWTSLITGYVECGKSQHALILYQKMKEASVHPSGHTFVALLKACASLKDGERGKEIHAEISRNGLLDRDPYVGNALVDMYVKCGWLAKAWDVFPMLPVRDCVSWTALIAGYAERGHGQEALNCFEQMRLDGVSPDAVTFLCSLKACGSIGAIDKGREIHAEIARKGLFDRDPMVGNALVDMYAKCGLLPKAQEVFDKLWVRDAVSWNALIGGYAENGHGQEALDHFEQMQLEGISPDAVTFVCSLKACGSIGATEKAREIHAEIARNGLLERDPCLDSTLVDVYAKCGSIANAREVFDKLALRDVVSWTAVIAGYAEHGLGQEALMCFAQMQLEGISPNAVTLVCGLKACGSIGAIEKGTEIHAEICRNGLLEKDPHVGNALVDMYAKCGLLAKAHEVFDTLQVRNAISCNALITGFAHLGESKKVFHLLDSMSEQGIKPDRVTFLGVLTACSRTGLVNKGQAYFEAMTKHHGIAPTIEHYTCMVDLLGSAGQLDEAVAMVKEMPFDPNIVVWHTLLGACRKWGNMELGRRALEHAVQLHQNDAAAYVLMSNISADVHMQHDTKWLGNDSK